MASSIPTTVSASAASVDIYTPQQHSSYTPIFRRHFHHSSPSKVSFRFAPKPTLPYSTKGLQCSWNRSTLVRGQLNEVAVDGSSNVPSVKSEVSSVDAKHSKLSNEAVPAALGSEESISEFITQVADLVKLVDSRDIVELQLQQLDCELLIRKKEALPQPPSSAPFVMMHPPSPAEATSAFQAAPPTAPTATSAPPPSSASSASPSPPATKPAKSSFPPLKCPMAGTLYRSPAPGELPFVKVGDKVQKGQVLCIIEAMKLMNEIEADQSGTIVEILAEDGKPVSVDTALFVIEP